MAGHDSYLSKYHNLAFSLFFLTNYENRNFLNELNDEPSPLPLESEMAEDGVCEPHTLNQLKADAAAESGKTFDTVTHENTYIIY